MKITYHSIGTIYSPFEKKEGMPIQAIAANGIKGKIEINKDLEEGLSDLDGFSHIILIYAFHRSEGFDLKIKPFLSDKFFGVFATRAPRRPNAIGISVVKNLSINKNIIEIENVDVLNGTPLLDIKPYIPEFDIHNVEKIGWIENKISEIAQAKSDERFNLKN
jgi:tRNA-Thr(GGU) m(6)t(6)A37 methyltransferase TsaA